MRVATYNILASCYLKKERYPHANIEELKGTKRVPAIAKRILQLHADIICLQEVEFETYLLLEKQLATDGFSALFAPKSFGKPEGCAIFFKRANIEYEGSKAIWYNDGTKWEAPSGHLALMIYVKRQNEIWGIANTHIKPNFTECPQEDHIGYRQIKELIKQHMSHNMKANHWILCGDFNSDDESIVVQSIESLGFVDSFATKKQATYKNRRIDYIFHSKNLYAKADTLVQIKGPLPNQNEPSDHIPVCADILLSNT